MSNNTDKIAALRQEADKLEAADNAFLALPEDARLAITLHSQFCNWNHTDGCSWHYEVRNGVHDWSGLGHAGYLVKGRKMLSFCQCNGISARDAIMILEIAKEF